jgi:23S rRNA (cytidine1920-2'-O)/16S rRNA (cytidine1409-2'-O)-methyltransferase
LKDIPEGAVIDVSFISLTLVLPVVIDLLNEKSTIIALVKPQFEVGKGKVGKKGVVRDANLHIEVLESLTEFIKTLCLEFRGLDFSPITGPEGNIEFLMHIEKGEYVNESKCIPAIKDIVYEAHKFFKDK